MTDAVEAEASLPFCHPGNRTAEQRLMVRTPIPCGCPGPRAKCGSQPELAGDYATVFSTAPMRSVMSAMSLSLAISGGATISVSPVTRT